MYRPNEWTSPYQEEDQIEPSKTQYNSLGTIQYISYQKTDSHPLDPFTMNMALW